MNISLCGWEADGSSSGCCQVPGFGISNIERTGSVSVSYYICLHHLILKLFNILWFSGYLMVNSTNFSCLYLIYKTKEKQHCRSHCFCSQVLSAAFKYSGDT
jgi:hypothetical protein